MSGRRIGILRIGSLGDHLIALPVYRQLRQMHDAESLVLISNAPTAASTKLIVAQNILPTGLFDAFYAYPVGSGWDASLAKLRLFRSIGLSSLYYLMPRRDERQLRRDRLFFRLAGIPVVGLIHPAMSRRAAHRSAAASETALVYAEHEADRLARAIPGLRSEFNRMPEYLSLGLTDQERAEGRSLAASGCGSAVALSIGTKCDVNHWGLDKWGALVTRLAALCQIERLMLVGSADEALDCDRLGRLWPRRWDNFCGRLSPRQSAAVVAEADLFVGHDSGPMHMAAAVGVPIVAIFSSRNLPGAWFPLSDSNRVHYTAIDCMGCGRVRCEDRHKACINLITVDEVFESCAAALGGGSRSSSAHAADGHAGGAYRSVALPT
jgi:lipopolysaccharide heptosyltransferase III